MMKLDEHVLYAVPVGRSDTDETSFLWVPALELVVAGDVAGLACFFFSSTDTSPSLPARTLRLGIGDMGLT